MGRFAVMGGTLGRYMDSWWRIGIAIFGGVMALGAPYLGQTSQDARIQGLGLIGGVFGVLMASILPIVEKFNANRELAQAREDTRLATEDAARQVDEATAQAKAKVLYLFDWCLTPLVDKLSAVIHAKKGTRIHGSEIGELKQQALRTVKEMIGTDPARIRANYFKLSYAPSGAPILRAFGSTSVAPRPEFDMGSDEGEAVLDMLAENGSIFCPDHLTDPPPGWDASKERAYRTFISATARANEEPDGMLTVDGVNPGDLYETDLPIVKLIATIIALSESRV